MKSHTKYFFKSWNKFVCLFLYMYNALYIWQRSVLWCLNWTILAMTRDLGCRVRCTPCSVRLARNSNIYITRHLSQSLLSSFLQKTVWREWFLLDNRIIRINEPLDFRTNRLSDYQDVRLSGRRIIATPTFYMYISH